MQSFEQRIGALLASDIDPDFLRSISIAIGWAYHENFNSVERQGGLTLGRKRQEYGRRRQSVVEDAITRVCLDKKVPYDWRRLDCNGQEKLIIKCGRVLLIHEAIVIGRKGPIVADYKAQLAGTYNVTRQLELDLGDLPGRIHDWSGDVVATILHGHVGDRFDAEHRGLGALRIAVADGSYDSWIIDVRLTELALQGRGLPDFGCERVQSQMDRTRVVLKSNAQRREKAK